VVESNFFTLTATDGGDDDDDDAPFDLTTFVIACGVSSVVVVFDFGGGGALGAAAMYDVRGKASRPSNIKVSKRSRNRIVSSTHLSSPYMAFSIESSIFESSISLVITLELRQRAERRPVSVDIDTIDDDELDELPNDLFKSESELFKSGFVVAAVVVVVVAGTLFVDGGGAFVDHLLVLFD